jgi:hypothetical protein
MGGREMNTVTKKSNSTVKIGGVWENKNGKLNVKFDEFFGQILFQPNEGYADPFIVKHASLFDNNNGFVSCALKLDSDFFVKNPIDPDPSQKFMTIANFSQKGKRFALDSDTYYGSLWFLPNAETMGKYNKEYTQDTIYSIKSLKVFEVDKGPENLQFDVVLDLGNTMFAEPQGS